MSELSAEYQWQKQRRRSDAPPNCMPLRGFGPNGEYTLWLPASEVTRKREFVNGKPVVTPVGPLTNDPTINALRHQVLMSCRTTNDSGPVPLLLADISLMEYSAALIQQSYDVNDDDLTMLHSGNAWMEPTLIHAMGGDLAKENWRVAPRMDELPTSPAASGDYVEPMSGRSEQGYEID